MNYKRILVIIISAIIIIFMAFFTNKNYAVDLDEIENYVITVDPRMNDGSLDITYEITWKVLDSTTEGPLTWVEIGTANPNFDSLQARTKNIKKIAPSKQSYVRIDFNRSYHAGEEVTFKYSLHQSYMYTISGNNCKYNFTPAWFKDAKTKNMTIRWNSDGIKSSNKKTIEDGYYIWNKKDIAKGKKMTAKVTYKKYAFSNLNEFKQVKNVRYKNYNNYNSSFTFNNFCFIIFIIIVSIALIGILNRGNYYSHSGFGGLGYYDNYHYHHHYYRGGCVHSSCACVSRCACANSCACACAGSGRAGCSKKDFYGTKINYDLLRQLKQSK